MTTFLLERHLIFLRYLCFIAPKCLAFLLPFSCAPSNPPKKEKLTRRTGVLGRFSSHTRLTKSPRVWSSDQSMVAFLSLFSLSIYLSTSSTAFCLHPRRFGCFADDCHACTLRFVLVLVL